MASLSWCVAALAKSRRYFECGAGILCLCSGAKLYAFNLVYKLIRPVTAGTRDLIALDRCSLYRGLSLLER